MRIQNYTFIISVGLSVLLVAIFALLALWRTAAG
jgi:hypothetical protein